jgi:hypothetical protein
VQVQVQVQGSGEAVRCTGGQQARGSCAVQGYATGVVQVSHHVGRLHRPQ